MTRLELIKSRWKARPKLTEQAENMLDIIMAEEPLEDKKHKNKLPKAKIEERVFKINYDEETQASTDKLSPWSKKSFEDEESAVREFERQQEES